MKVYHNLSHFPDNIKTAITTGTFDGVHLGHQKIIGKLLEAASSVQGESVVVTFDPHPRIVLFPDDSKVKLLSTLKEKTELLENCGVNHLVIIPFTKEFSRLSSMEFVRNILVNALHAKKLVIGYDHHFGRNREGTFQHLSEFGPVYGFDVEEIPAQDIDEVAISSSKIRMALENGHPENARIFLGRPYDFSGMVVEGKKLGRTIGFPTANLHIADAHKLLPAKGVYAVRIQIGEKMYDGMMNIGTNPTVSDSIVIKTEVHIFDFDGELTGVSLKIFVLNNLRNEMKFGSLDDLKNQLQQDRDAAKKILHAQV